VTTPRPKIVPSIDQLDAEALVPINEILAWVERPRNLVCREIGDWDDLQRSGKLVSDGGHSAWLQKPQWLQTRRF